MARPASSDYLHSMRFHVSTTATPGTPGDVTQTAPAGSGMAEAGFSACTTPEATVEAVEYKEGQFLYTRKYPGHVTYNDVTLSRGVAQTDTGFWRWLRAVVEGGADYRQHVTIKHFHRSDVLPGSHSPPAELLNLVKPTRQYQLFEAFPARHKFSSDLDATDSAISIQELDLSYEHAAILDSAGNVTENFG